MIPLNRISQTSIWKLLNFKKTYKLNLKVGSTVKFWQLFLERKIKYLGKYSK